MKHLYFVRHGESELNKARLFAGQVDTPLTTKGRQQAKLVGSKARNYKFDLIVSSPLVRALETAQIIASAIDYPADKIIINDLFKEHFMGSLAYKSWDDYNEFDNTFKDGETWEALVERARSGLEFLQGLPESEVLLVGHGAFFRALKTVLNPDQNYDEPQNAQISQLI